MYLFEKKAHQTTKNKIQMLREQLVELEGKLKINENVEVGELRLGDEKGAAHDGLSVGRVPCSGDLSYRSGVTLNVGGI